MRVIAEIAEARIAADAKQAADASAARESARTAGVVVVDAEAGALFIHLATDLAAPILGLHHRVPLVQGQVVLAELAGQRGARIRFAPGTGALGHAGLALVLQPVRLVLVGVEL